MPHDSSALHERLDAVRERISRAAQRSGRSADHVKLVAVTKTIDPAVVEAAYALGLRDFGENRAQELVAKSRQLPRDVRWHMIGRLQSNKVRTLAGTVTLWHSIDRIALIDELARHEPGAAILIEVNVAGESTKGGCRPDDVDMLVGSARDAGVVPLGLMTVPPHGADPRPHFRQLAQLARRHELAQLSMGMTDDFEVAIECGATIVRIGSAIFGPRPPVPAARN